MSVSKRKIRKALYKHYKEIINYCDCYDYTIYADGISSYEQWQVDFSTWLANAAGVLRSNQKTRFSSWVKNDMIKDLVRSTRYNFSHAVPCYSTECYSEEEYD